MKSEHVSHLPQNALSVAMQREGNDSNQDDDTHQDHEDEIRPMNDSTLPKSMSATGTGSKLPRRKQAPPAGSGRRYGLADWNRLLEKNPNLMGHNRDGPKKMGWTEIRKHNTVHDGWIVLRGKVYNISPYLAYHPGGATILERVLGKDVTALYDKYHRWVNETGLIGKLLIGYLDTRVDEDSDEEEDGRGAASYLPQQMSSDGFAVPRPRKK